jgi:hypothetical protein
MKLMRLIVPVLVFVWVGLFPSTAAAQKTAPPKPLSITNVALSQYEDGPNVPANHYFVPGETIFFSFQIGGYKPEGDVDEGLGVRLAWNMEVRDSSGIAVIPPHGGKIATSLAQEDKNWMPKPRHVIELPPFLDPGKYTISMKVTDEVSKLSAAREVEFTVRGRVVEPSSTVAVRNLNFYRDENDTKPAPVPAYRPGDTVWIKFDITGYKFAENNRFQVGYGITVLRPNGEATLSQPEAAVETDQTFYPRRVLPAMLSLNLPKDVQVGEFTVIITATDKIGEQQHEARATFTVEK